MAEYVAVEGGGRESRSLCRGPSLRPSSVEVVAARAMVVAMATKVVTAAAKVVAAEDVTSDDRRWRPMAW